MLHPCMNFKRLINIENTESLNHGYKAENEPRWSTRVISEWKDIKSLPSRD